MGKPVGKVSKVMHEFKAGTLRSGKPGPGKGPTVTSRKQAIAIGLSQARKMGEQVAPEPLGNAMSSHRRRGI